MEKFTRFGQALFIYDHLHHQGKEDNDNIANPKPKYQSLKILRNNQGSRFKSKFLYVSYQVIVQLIELLQSLQVFRFQDEKSMSQQIS